MSSSATLLSKYKRRTGASYWKRPVWSHEVTALWLKSDGLLRLHDGVAEAFEPALGADLEVVRVDRMDQAVALHERDLVIAEFANGRAVDLDAADGRAVVGLQLQCGQRDFHALEAADVAGQHGLAQLFAQRAGVELGHVLHPYVVSASLRTGTYSEGESLTKTDPHGVTGEKNTRIVIKVKLVIT